MAYTYHIRKPRVFEPAKDVYYVGGVNWSDQFSERKKYTSQAKADATIVNTDGTNGGFKNATVVREE